VYLSDSERTKQIELAIGDNHQFYHNYYLMPVILCDRSLILGVSRAQRSFAERTFLQQQKSDLVYSRQLARILSERQLRFGISVGGNPLGASPPMFQNIKVSIENLFHLNNKVNANWSLLALATLQQLIAARNSSREIIPIFLAFPHGGFSGSSHDRHVKIFWLKILA